MTPTISQTINFLLWVIFIQAFIGILLGVWIVVLQRELKSLSEIDRLLKSGLKDRGEYFKSKGAERP